LVPARLLDLTRSLRRAGRLPTGVDRVERAYLAHMLADDVPLFGLLRTAFGYLLLGHDGVRAFHKRLDGQLSWPVAGVLFPLPRKRDVHLVRAEKSVRRDAVARCLPFGLRNMLCRHLPKGFEYFNIGHSNLTDRVFGSVKAAGGTAHVFVHDIIPLEHPEFQRPGTVAPFKAKLQRVCRNADRVIYNSGDTRARAEAQMAVWGPVPPAIVAHLGTPDLQPCSDELPTGLPPNRPYFVTIGTIEPRKNHAFLLDLWDRLGPDAPHLLICGNRGWNNKEVFDRLDNLAADSPVMELPGLTDRALAALLQSSNGLLFPTHAEGFGLPAVEALTLGARVLCNDLPVFHEVLGSFANFVPVADSQSWLEMIKKWETEPSTADRAIRFEGPNWADHLNTVLRLR
jgi:glycosyltransferase involved in cell wall biosynthesis